MTLCDIKNIWIRRNFICGIVLLTLLFGAVILSVIPAKYTAIYIVNISRISPEVKNINDIISDEDYINSIKDEEIALIRSPKFINNIVKKLKLEKHPEFNIDLDTNRAISTKIIDKIYGIGQVEIFYNINKNLVLSFTIDNKLYIKYESSMPYLSKVISDTIAKEYIQQINPNILKAINQKADKPKYPSNINFIKSIITILMLGLLFGIIGAIYINKRK